MLLIIFRQKILDGRNPEEKVDFLVISLDEKWHYFIGQNCPPSSIEPTKAMANVYIESQNVFEVFKEDTDPIRIAFFLIKMGYPNKREWDEVAGFREKLKGDLHG